MTNTSTDERWHASKASWVCLALGLAVGALVLVSVFSADIPLVVKLFRLIFGLAGIVTAPAIGGTAFLLLNKPKLFHGAFLIVGVILGCLFASASIALLGIEGRGFTHVELSYIDDALTFGGGFIGYVFGSILVWIASGNVDVAYEISRVLFFISLAVMACEVPVVWTRGKKELKAQQESGDQLHESKEQPMPKESQELDERPAGNNLIYGKDGK